MTVSPRIDQGTRGRQNNFLGGERTPKAIRLRPQGLAAAFSATVTKTSQGKKRRGEEQREMGRAGPTPSSCRFLSMSLRGPESRAAAPGRPIGALGSGHPASLGLPFSYLRDGLVPTNPNLALPLPGISTLPLPLSPPPTWHPAFLFTFSVPDSFALLPLTAFLYFHS